ncbi:hypothetical protein BJX68DRAFT_57224 [Aspergillus pseudodeflectus]|uniref:Uncharacterized protein n=1 Tax=Aspergillus pseudodeflectus TaxID=176178 RepID=A0ABR4KL02_9EURO
MNNSHDPTRGSNSSSIVRSGGKEETERQKSARTELRWEETQKRGKRRATIGSSAISNSTESDKIMMFQYNHNNASDLLLLIDIPPCLTASILLQPPSLRQVVCIHSLSALPTHLPRLVWGSQFRLSTLCPVNWARASQLSVWGAQNLLSIMSSLLSTEFGGVS